MRKLTLLICFFTIYIPVFAQPKPVVIKKADSLAADAFYEKGVTVANEQKWDEALSNFLSALQKDSTKSFYYKAVGNVYVYKEEFSLAVKYYSKAIQLNNKDFEPYFYRAGAYYHLEDMDASCTDFKTALAKIPAKDTDEVIKEVKTEIEMKLSEFCDSSRASYYYQRGIASYNLKQFDKAIGLYNRGLKKFPAHCMLTSFRANAWLVMGRFKEADADYTQCLVLKDKLMNEANGSLNFWSASPQEKSAYIAHMIADIYQHRAEARLDQGNYAGASADIDQAITMLPAGTEGKEAAYNLQGAIYMAQDDYNTALTCFTIALQTNPGYTSALVNRGAVKLNLAYKTKVTDRQIMMQNAHITLPSKAQATVNTGTLESALTDCNKAITIDPSYGYAYYVRAAIKISLDQADYCYDLLKAEQLGYELAKEMIADKKCR